MRHGRYGWMGFVWFAIGVGSNLQVVASLSIAEIIILVAAPILFFTEFPYMRRDGTSIFFYLSLLVIVGCGVGAVLNHTYVDFVLRGLAATVVISLSIIFSHWILRRAPLGFKWFFVGSAISLFLCAFIMRNATEVYMYGDDTEAIINGPLFWINRLKAVLLVPTQGWYLHMPMAINVCAPLFIAIFALQTSSSGRAASLTAVGFAILVLVGGKKRHTMVRISNHFWIMCSVAVVGIFLLHGVYRLSVQKDWLGEQARIKYEVQSQGEKGIMRLLLGGRTESFVGLLACRDKPIVGWGPWAMDEKGYYDEFVDKFGTYDDWVQRDKLKLLYGQRGMYWKRRLPCHAWITQFWAWYGIFGLIFMLYILFVTVRFLKQDVAVVPQWFGWLACTVPLILWDFFFSPFKDRVGLSLYIVACLMARAVRKGKFQLPWEMIDEIEKSERS